jgi:hypothetical protein
MPMLTYPVHLIIVVVVVVVLIKSAIDNVIHKIDSLCLCVELVFRLIGKYMFGSLC